MTNEFTALTSLRQPGVDTYAYGYRRGDEVRAAVVESWGLEVGVDVVKGDLTDDVPHAAAPVRPGEEANRADWEAWGRANGMSEDEAAAASMDDLQGAEAEAPADDYPRPADSAKKADWVDYVTNHPQATENDKAWAKDDATTKAGLQAWEPAQPAKSGDPIAEAATEAVNG